MTILDFLPYLASILALGGTVGGLFFAIRKGYSKEAGEIQERTIVALQTQISTLERQVEADKKETTHLKRVMSAVKYALKREGFTIEIDGESVTLIDDRGGKRARTIAMRTVKEDETITSLEDDSV